MQGVVAPRENPAADDLDRMRSAMADLECAQKTLMEELADKADEIAELQDALHGKDGEIRCLEREIARLKGQLEDRMRDADALVRVRTQIKQGVIGGALYDLETVLSDLDGAWRARA